MKTNKQTWIFISVFYRRGNWHLLLDAVRKVTEFPEVRKELKDLRLFINNDRGESVRLALKMQQSVDCEASQIIADSIKKFLRDNPTEIRPVLLPISGFFADFENNSIKYNLFNDRSIMPCRLAIFQVLISKLLLHFFRDHPVDEDGLFTLVAYLQKAILNGLCTNQKEKINLLMAISKQVKANGIQLEYEALLRADRISPNYTREDLQGTCDIEAILTKFELAVKVYQRENPGKGDNFLIILNIIYLQLGKPAVSTFLDALQYLFIDLQKSPTKSKKLKQTNT